MASLAPPISVQLTPRQLAWLDGRRQRGLLSRSAALRLVLDELIQQEGSNASQKTYAAITSRSHHPGIVGAAMMDGSVRTIRNDIAVSVWRALGTRAGAEWAAAP